MTTLYLPPFLPDLQGIWKAATRLDWNLLQITDWEFINSLTPIDSSRVLYGDSKFVKLAAQPLQIRLYQPPTNLLYLFGSRFTKRRILHFTYRSTQGFGSCVDLSTPRLHSLIDWNSLRTPFFVKPVEKGSFPAQVYSDPVKELVFLPDQTEIIVSDPVTFQIEFRAFCSGRKVQTIAPYARSGQPTTQAQPQEWQEGEEFANQAARIFGTPYVLDVGLTEHGWAVVNARSAWDSELYGCDPQQALLVIKEACQCF